jgi:hypothetical protein
MTLPTLTAARWVIERNFIGWKVWARWTNVGGAERAGSALVAGWRGLPV